MSPGYHPSLLLVSQHLNHPYHHQHQHRHPPLYQCDLLSHPTPAATDSNAFLASEKRTINSGRSPTGRCTTSWKLPKVSLCYENPRNSGREAPMSLSTLTTMIIVCTTNGIPKRQLLTNLARPWCTPQLSTWPLQWRGRSRQKTGIIGRSAERKVYKQTKTVSSLDGSIDGISSIPPSVCF